MKKKKQPELLGEAIRLTLGSTIVGSLPNSNVNMVAQSAFRIASIGLPITSANYTLNQLKKLKKLD